ALADQSHDCALRTETARSLAWRRSGARHLGVSGCRRDHATLRTRAARDDANSKTVSAADLAVNMIAELAMAGMAISWVVFRVRATPSDLGLTLSRIGPDVVLGGATFFAAILPVGQIQKYLVENVTPYDHPL